MMIKGIRLTLSIILLLLAVVAQAQEQDDDDVIQLVNEPCVNWETTAAAYQEAFAEWQEPECYTFGYTFLGFSVGEPEMIRRNVRNGVALPAKDGNGDEDQTIQTITDVWNLIDENCIQNCPTSGAHRCFIEYATAAAQEVNTSTSNFMYPAYVSIDPDSVVIDEELIYRIDNVRTLDCADLDALDEEHDEDDAGIKPDVCVNYETVQTNLQTAMLQWENVGGCYNYTIENVGRVTEEYRGPFAIIVQNDTVMDVMSALAPPDDMTNRTLSDWLLEIQDRCVDQCQVEMEGEPYYDCRIDYDATLGYPTYMMFDPDPLIIDEELYYMITNFSSCEEQIIGDNEEEVENEDEEGISKSAVCIDYETVKSEFDAALQKWNLVDPCYNYIIERQGRIADEFRGPFAVQVRDGVAQVVNIASDNSESMDGPNMTFTLSDWMSEIDQHCVAGCETTDQAEAYYYCSLEYDPTWGYPTSIFFDPDENLADEELYYTLSNFTPCGSETVPDGNNSEASNCTDLSDDAYEFEATYARLETLLAENPCYDFTYIATGFLYPPPEPVTVSFRDESEQQSGDDFASLFDVMDFYKTTCFPCNSTVRPFSCSISFDDLGVPTVIWIDYMEMLADEEAGYTISNVTFVPCSAPPTQQNCDSGWIQAKSKWSSPACYDYSVRRIGEIPTDRQGPFTIQVRDNKVVNGSAISVNMTLDDMFALIEEKCVAGCPDTEAFRCNNTYNSEIGFPTRIYIDYDELMADEEESYVISDFQSVACDSENGDDDAATMCRGWEQVSDTLDAMEENWNDPPCYQYTIKANDETPITVHVRDSIVMSPNKSDTSNASFEPGTLDEFMAVIRATCIDGCPSMGLANCDFESSGDGPVGNWVIATTESTRNFNVSDYEVVPCDKEIVTSTEDTSASSTDASITIPFGLFTAIAFLFH